MYCAISVKTHFSMTTKYGQNQLEDMGPKLLKTIYCTLDKYGSNELCSAFWRNLLRQKFSCLCTECLYFKSFNSSYTKSTHRRKPSKYQPHHLLDWNVARQSKALIFTYQMSKNVFLNISTLEDNDTTLPWNIRIWVPSETPSYPSRMKSYDISVVAPAAFITFKPSPQSLWSQPSKSIWQVINWLLRQWTSVF